MNLGDAGATRSWRRYPLPATPTYVLHGLTFTSELLAQVERLLSPVKL